MKIVVDTNIVFSALLNTSSTIGNLLFHSSGICEFYSCAYMRTEMHKHWQKLKSISKLSDEELQTTYDLILLRVLFVQEELIALETLRTALSLVENTDPDDVDFVALAMHLNAALWTGDKPLYNGLKAAGFEAVLNTSDVLQLRAGLMKT